MSADNGSTVHIVSQADSGSKDRNVSNDKVSPSNRKGVMSLDSELQGHIGRQLKAVYDDVVSQPVPDRFLELLQLLDKSQDPSSSKPKASQGDPS